MKDQYFGDINDYRKYGLLRAIAHASDLKLLIAWMLTPNDTSADGQFISYLDQPAKWSHHDHELFNSLRELLSTRARSVSMIEQSTLLPNTEFHSSVVPDSSHGREQWFDTLVRSAKSADLVFLDPDNGLEVKSKPFGRKYSSKFLYWREVRALWASGKSLLIYQHFIREKRSDFIQRMSLSLSQATPGSLVESFSTPHVVFLMALQPNHQRFHADIVNSVLHAWGGQINPSSPAIR